MTLQQLFNHLTTSESTINIRKSADFTLKNNQIISQLISHDGYKFVTITISPNKNDFDFKGVATEDEINNIWLSRFLIWLVVGSFKRRLNHSLKIACRREF
jgi:hypothetical protein